MLRIRRRTTFLLSLFLLLSLAAPALAQTGDDEIVIVDVDTSRYDEDGQVTMVVEVRNVEDFDPSELVVTEGGTVINDVEVDVDSQTSVEVGIVLAIDVSLSMQNGPLEAAKEAAIEFVNGKSELDSIALVTFSSEVEVVVPFTTSARTVTQAIADLSPTGNTSFYDAVVTSADLYDRSELQPHMIVLTDGADDGSTATLEEAIEAAEANGVRVFGIALESEAFQGGPLQELASSTNGLYLATTDTGELSSLYSQIQRELNNKITVRFSASESRATTIDLAISYETLRDNQQTTVPGFILPNGATAENGASSTTPATFAPPQSRLIESTLPVSAGTLKLIGVAGVGVASLLIMFILFGSTGEDGSSEMARRLAQFERNRPASEEESKSIFSRIAFLRNLSRSAEEAAEKRGLLNSVNALLEQSNIALKPGEAIASALGLSILVGLVVGSLTRSVFFAVLTFVVFVLLAYVTVAFVGRRERTKFEDQLPDTLTLLATSLRAGYSLLQAIEAVAGEAPEPTAREYARAIAEIRLGRQVVDALRGISERTQSADFDWVVIAIEIQREVGGNLAEVLNTVAETMLQRNRLRRDVKAMTAEGRLSAIILGVMPFGVLLAIQSFNPDYIRPLFEGAGRLVLVGGMISMIIGFYWSFKITDIQL